jgi:hypothetical protein
LHNDAKSKPDQKRQNGDGAKHIASFGSAAQDIDCVRIELHCQAAFELSCSMGIPWICRGLILSGYPFFPSSAFAQPVDWMALPVTLRAVLFGAKVAIQIVLNNRSSRRLRL